MFSFIVLQFLVSFWSVQRWQAVWQDLCTHHGYLQDANQALEEFIFCGNVASEHSTHGEKL